MTTRAPLHDFSRNVYSQHGEDGIVEEVLRRLASASALDNWCVEFGAWDGMHLSNTYNLISAKGYKAVLIEADKKKFQTLCRNVPQEDVHKICRLVGFEGEAALDRILASTPIPKDFDFLSIDIDGCDYFIFESVEQYRPKLVCIEYNPTIPNEVEFVQPKDFGIKQGASAKSLALLAARKGYSLIAVTLTNLLFLRLDLLEPVVGPQRNSLESLRDDSEFRVFLFTGYDGTILSNKASLPMPWHGMQPGLNAFQQLPRALRRLSSDYNFLQKILFALLSRSNVRKPSKNSFAQSPKKSSSVLAATSLCAPPARALRHANPRFGPKLPVARRPRRRARWHLRGLSLEGARTPIRRDSSTSPRASGAAPPGFGPAECRHPRRSGGTGPADSARAQSSPSR